MYQGHQRPVGLIKCPGILKERLALAWDATGKEIEAWTRGYDSKIRKKLNEADGSKREKKYCLLLV